MNKPSPVAVMRNRSLSEIALFVAGCFLSGTALAEKTSNWRVFRASDGLRDSFISAVTVSPRGNVWVKHGDADEISVLNGYTIQTIPSPGKDNYRVYESRTGQLWALYSEGTSVEGVTVHDGKQWVHHPLAEIRAESVSDPLRWIARQIPLLPAERDHVLILLSTNLLKYDAVRKQVTVLKEVADTGLGRFSEMTEARDGNGVWITGTKGLAKVSGQLRDLNPGSPWEQHLLEESFQVENLQRPFENERGEVVTVATDTLTSSKKVLLKFDGQRWSKQAAPGENVRQGWPGWDQTIWGYTSVNSLLRFDEGATPAMTKERVWVGGQYKDVATEANGAFWLATSDGLVRYAPFPWRTPNEVEEVDALVHAALEDGAGRLWFASTASLNLNRNDRWQAIKWPDGFEPDFQATDSLYALPQGGIAIGAGDKPLLFDPATGQFAYLLHRSGGRVRILGQFKDGQLCVLVRPSNAASPRAYQLEQFDGRQFSPFNQAQPEREWIGELNFVYAARTGDLWFGGNGGLAVARAGQFQRFGPAEGFIEEKPLCLLELDDGKIWCGGGDRILQYNGHSWSVVRSGLDRVSQMRKARNGKLWIATGRGLFSYAEGTWVMNGVEEGLPSPAVSAVLEDRRGRIWAGTSRGISLYHPDADVHPPKTLPPTVENAGQSSTEGPITVVFNAVDRWQYTPADRLLFSWRIDGGQWSPYTNAMTEFVANMAAGKHRFEVRSMDRSWNTDRATAFAEMSITVPWYKESRLIVILICGLVLVLFFAGLAVNRHWQLIRSYAEVEKIVAVRTRELERANQELLHSQKMRALGTLAAGIAHDFNNILSIIKGSAQIIESHLEDKDKIRTRVGRIKTVVEQGAGIVKSMLGLTRVTEQDLVSCDLNTAVDETIRLLGDQYLQEVTIQFEAAPSLPPIPAVKELIQQMLLNLILNASDAMSEGGEVLIRTGQMNTLPENLALSPAPAGSFLFVAVQDTGCGIAPDVLPRIFEPFFTTKAFSTRRGTGLGLSMVYELGKEMGYGLKVKSSPGKGSTFTIIIPVKGG